MQAALQLDLPALPQLPAENAAELMIPAALEGLPGLRFDEDGVCTLSVKAWEQERLAFESELARALEGPGLEPMPSSCRAWKPFLWELESRKLKLAKVQLAGPATVRWATRLDSGDPVSSHAALDQQIFRLVLARALGMVRALKAAGSMPVFFLDEPGLYALERLNPRHAVVLQELKMMVLALQREGALVGIHCCSNTHWPSVLGLGVDLVSLDVRLSLNALLDEPAPLQAFLSNGGRLSLGIIPTDLSASGYELRDLVESAREALVAAGLEAALSRALLTPACGLGMRSVPDAEMIFEELHQAQRMMRAAIPN